MSTKRFNLEQVEQPDKLNQRFSFSGKVRGADVLLRLVEACGYEVVREALDKLKPAPPAKHRRPPRPEVLPSESSIQPPAPKPVAPPAPKRPARAPAGGRKEKSSD